MVKRTHGDLTVGVRELRANLSRHLTAVADGSVVVITDHGRPIARLVAVEEITPGFRRLVEEGRIRLPGKPATDPSTWKRLAPRGNVSNLVREQRG